MCLGVDCFANKYVFRHEIEVSKGCVGKLKVCVCVFVCLWVWVCARARARVHVRVCVLIYFGEHANLTYPELKQQHFEINHDRYLHHMFMVNVFF